MQTDLSVWGMYQHADIVVKIVMIGLILASVVTGRFSLAKALSCLATNAALSANSRSWLAPARWTTRVKWPNVSARKPERAPY